MNKKDNDYGTGIPKHEIIALAQCLLPEIRQFFDSEDGKREFEAWKAEQAIISSNNKITKRNEVY